MMKKIILFLLIGLLLLSINSAYAANLKTVIYYDVAINAKGFQPGEPIIIFLILSNPDAMNAYYQNIAYGNEDKKIIHTQLGTNKESWIKGIKFTLRDSQDNIVKIDVQATAVTENKVILDEVNAIEHVFYITPQETAKLKPDNYSLSATIDNAESNSLNLPVIANARRDNEINHLVKNGRYALIRGNFAEAKKIADSVLAIDKHSLLGLDILGDALAGLKLYTQAYKTYDELVKEYFIQYPPVPGDGTYEVPEITIDKMRSLEPHLD